MTIRGKKEGGISSEEEARQEGIGLFPKLFSRRGVAEKKKKTSNTRNQMRSSRVVSSRAFVPLLLRISLRKTLSRRSRGKK